MPLGPRKFFEIRQILHELLDELFEFCGADNPNLEAEIAQQAADIVFYGDGFSLEQLSRRQQRPLLLARQRLHMDRPEQVAGTHPLALRCFSLPDALMVQVKLKFDRFQTNCIL
jgi:hypothetical protein